MAKNENNKILNIINSTNSSKIQIIQQRRESLTTINNNLIITTNNKNDDEFNFNLNNNNNNNKINYFNNNDNKNSTTIATTNTTGSTTISGGSGSSVAPIEINNSGGATSNVISGIILGGGQQQHQQQQQQILSSLTTKSATTNQIQQKKPSSTFEDNFNKFLLETNSLSQQNLNLINNNKLTTKNLHQQQGDDNIQDNSSIMPKTNEPLKIAYPISSNNQQNQQQINNPTIQYTQPLVQQNLTINNQSGGAVAATGSAALNRVTFTSQSLPNGTINITSQPQQQQGLMNTVSSLPSATTIRTISAGQQQQHNASTPNIGTSQTLVIKNQTVTLPAGLVSSAPGLVTMTKAISQGNQTNTTMLPPGVVMNVRATNQNQPRAMGNTSNTIPRVIIAPHMVNQRPNNPTVSMNSLNAAQTASTLLVRTENGYQILKIGPPPTGQVGQNVTANATGNQTIRFQTVPAVSRYTTTSGSSLALRKTIVTQHQVKQKQNSNVPTSLVVNSVSTSNSTQVLSSQPNAIQQQTTVASVAPVSTTFPHHPQQQISHVSQQIQHTAIHASTASQQPHQHQNIQTQLTTTTNQQQPQQQNVQQSPQTTATQGNTKEKCRKFLANLIELSTREPKPVEKNVRTLIQELIDANVEPEEFCDRLERLLNASPQPCLIGFLKKSLPLLRQSLFTRELVIDGIRPPPQQVVGMMGTTTTLQHQLPRIQAQIRPIGQTTTIGQTQVRMVSQSATTRPIGQTTITKQPFVGGGVRIQGPINTTITGPRIVNATQIRPVSAIDTTNIQSPPALLPVSRQNIVPVKTAGIRTPGTVQIRTSTPVRAKNMTTTLPTQVKVGQTQIKQISNIQNNVNTSLLNTLPVSNNLATSIVTTTAVAVPQPNLVNSNLPHSMVNNSSSVSTISNGSNTPNSTTIQLNASSKILTLKTSKSAESSTKTKKKQQLLDEKSVTSTSSFFQPSSMSNASTLYGDDDINDVAAMGGVNLAEESQKILGSTENIGTQIRSCKDEVFLHMPALQNKIRTIVAQKGLDDASHEVAVLISHACQERLKNIIEKLAIIAEHRIDVLKVDTRYEITKDVRGQVKFLEELDKAEQKRHEEQEREMLMRAAKSRSKIEDPEQAKLKAKAKEMQRAEMEELRQRDANLTALQAIGPRKKPKLENDTTAIASPSGTPSGNSSTGISATSRPRIKRVNLRDMIFYMEQERETCRSEMLYKAYLK